ncbi:MAG: T9SS type A sorting domain-containing protein, partial [Ignavibacteriota bacterium]
KKSVSNVFNYPNPFSNATTITVDIPQRGVVSLDIVSVDGKFSRRIFERNFEAGSQRIPLEFGDIASGNYLAIARCGSLTASKMIQCLK